MDSREGEGFESNACNREANFYESILPLNKSSGIQTREKKIQQPDISEQYPGVWRGSLWKKIREFVIMKKSPMWLGSKTVTQESETFSPLLPSLIFISERSMGIKWLALPLPSIQMEMCRWGSWLQWTKKEEAKTKSKIRNTGWFF